MARVILYNTTVQQNTQGGITIKENQNYTPVGSESIVKPVVKPSVKKSKKKRKSKKWLFLSEDKKVDQKSSGQKGGRGTHGSLTKAGKVRSQTPIIPKTNVKKRNGPSKQNRKEFYLFSKKAKEANLKPKADYQQR